MTTREVAIATGKSMETVKRWRVLGLVVPSNFIMSGKTKVWLYTPEDVMKARYLTKTIKPGPKQKESNDNASTT